MIHIIFRSVLIILVLLLSGCARDNYSVIIECEECFDKLDDISLEITHGNGVFAVYMISEGDVVDARYFTENGDETFDLFAAFGNENFLPEYLFDEGVSRAVQDRSRRIYPLIEYPEDNLIDVKTRKSLNYSLMPLNEQTKYDIVEIADLKKISQFKFSIPFGSKKYSDGDETYLTGFEHGQVGDYIRIDNPIDKVIVVSPLGGIFVSDCTPYRYFYKKNTFVSSGDESRYNDVKCDDFYPDVYNASGYAAFLTDPFDLMTFLQFPLRYLHYLKNNNYNLNEFGEYSSYRPYNLRTLEDGTEVRRKLTGSSSFKDLIIKSDYPFSAYAIDELVSPNVATPLECLAADGKIAHLNQNSERTLLTLNSSVKFSPYIHFDTSAGSPAPFHYSKFSILSYISDSKGKNSHAFFDGINFFDLCASSSCPPIIKPYSYSENGFYLHDLYSEETITIDENCSPNSISDISLYGEYPNNTIRRVGESVKIQVDFTFPVKVKPSGQNGYSNHSISFSIGEQVVTAFGDEEITRGLSTAQIENNYISGMVFTFTVTDDMYSEGGIQFNEFQDELYFDRRYASFNLKNFDMSVPTHSSLTIAGNNLSIIPEVDAPSVIGYQAILSDEMHVTPSDKLDEKPSSSSSINLGPFWSRGRLSSTIYKTVIDILPWQYNTTLSYRVTFSDEISGLDVDDFQLVDINGQPSAAILEVRPATLTGAAIRSQKTSSDRFIVTVGQFTGQTTFKLVLKDSASFYKSVGGRRIDGVVESYTNLDFDELPGSIIRFNDALDTPKLGELITSDTFFPNGVPSEANVSFNTILPTFIPTREHFDIVVLSNDGTSLSKLGDEIGVTVTPSFETTLEEFPHFYNLRIDLSSLAQENIDFANLSIFVNTSNTKPIMTKWGRDHNSAIGSSVNITAPTVENIRLHSADNAQVTFALDTSESVYVRRAEDFLQCCELQTSNGTILPLSLTGLNEGSTFLLQADVSDLVHDEVVTFSLAQASFPLEGTDGSGVGNTRLSLRDNFDNIDVVLDKTPSELATSYVNFTNAGPVLTLQFDEVVNTNLSNLSDFIRTADDAVLDVTNIVETTNQGYSVVDVTFDFPHQLNNAQIKIDLSNASILDDFNNQSIITEIQEFEVCFPNITIRDFESNILDDDASINLLEGGDAKTLSIALSCPPSDIITVQVARVDNFSIRSNGRREKTIEFTFTPSNWNEPQLLELELLDNGYFESERTSRLGLEVVDTASDNTGYNQAPTRVIGLTLQDDDYYLKTDDPYIGFGLEDGVSSPHINVSGNGVSEIPTKLVLEVIGAQLRLDPEYFSLIVAETDNLQVRPLESEDTFKYEFSTVPNGPTEDYSSIRRVEFIAQSTVYHDEVVAWFDIKIDHSEVLTSVTEQVLVEGGDASTLTVQLDSPPIEPTRFDVTSSDETELTVSPNVIEFNEFNWNQPQQIVITPVQDIEQEGDTNVSISLSISDTTEYYADNVYARYPRQTFNFNVQQSALSSFSVSELNGQLSEGGQAQFTVVLNEPPTLPSNSQTIFISTNNNEATVSSRELVFTDDNWNIPQTVLVRGTDDSNVDGTTNVTIGIRSVTGSTSLQNVNTSIRATVLDNDNWPEEPDFSISVPKFYEGYAQFPEWQRESISLTSILMARPNRPTEATFEVVYDVNEGRVVRGKNKSERFTLYGGSWYGYDYFRKQIKAIDDNVYNGSNIITGVIRYVDGDEFWEGFEKNFTYELVDDEIGFQLTDMPLQISSGESWDFNVYLSAFRVGEMAGFFENRRPTERYADIQLSTNDPQVSVSPTSMKIESHNWNKNRPYHNETDIRLTYIQDGENLQSGLLIHQQALIFNTDNWNVPQIIEIETYGEVDSGQSAIYGVRLNIDETIENRDSRFDSSDAIFDVVLTNEPSERSNDSMHSKDENAGLILSENIIYTYPSETATIAVSLNQAPQGEVRVSVEDLGKKVKLQLRSTGGGLNVKPKDVIIYAQKQLGLIKTEYSIAENETDIGALNPSYSANVSLGDSEQSDMFSITNNFLSLRSAINYEVSPEQISLPLIITDSFGNQVNQTISVIITDANDEPVISISNSMATDEDQSISSSFTYTDEDQDTVSATVSTNPTNGEASVDGTNVTYTPAANFNGQDSFVLTLTDGNGYETTQTINVTVRAINDRPFTLPIPDQEFNLGDYIELNITDYFGDIDEGDELRFSIEGQLPEGLTFNNGLLKGMIEFEGSLEIIAIATDISGLSASSSLIIRVDP